MPDVSLRAQLACARRELALRLRLYPRLVAQETMLHSTALRELKQQAAIIRTLARLVAAEDGAGGQVELFEARTGGEAEQ